MLFNILLKFTNSLNNTGKLRGYFKVNCYWIKDNIGRRNSYSLGTDVSYNFFTSCTINMGFSNPLNISNSNAIVDVIKDTLGDCFLKSTLSNLILHIGFDGVPLLFNNRVSRISFPLEPTIIGEQCIHVVSMKVVPNLGSFRDS